MPDSVKNVLIALFAVLVVVAGGYAVAAPQGGPTAAQVSESQRELDRFSAEQALAARQHAQRMVVLGDSYTGGSAMGGGGYKGWPSLVATRLGWTPVLNAVGGSGFLSGGQTGPFKDRVASVLAADPNVIVVEGGHNDGSFSAESVLVASRQVLMTLRRGAPQARLIVIGPIWPSGDAPQVQKDIDAGLKSQAKDLGAIFVDPIRDGWFAGAFTKLIGTDGTHPTDAGHQHIANLIYPTLKGLALPAVATDPVQQ